MKSSDSNTRLTPEQGELLVRLARQTLVQKLAEKPDTAPMDNPVELRAKARRDIALNEKSGTFVTLKKNGRLRGCIGNLSTVKTIWEGICQNAENAAFHDGRFPPLTTRELDRITIEISVLTRPVPLAYTDGEDLAAKLRPGTDGVVLHKGAAGATFLPQVWEDLPEPVVFLSRLCQKAGLEKDAWRHEKLTVETYQVQHFS